MKLVTAFLFSRLPAESCVFAFAGLWTLLLPGRNVHGNPLELQAALVQEGQSRGGCVSFSVQGSNFSFFAGVYPAYCDGLQPLFPGETLESSVFLSPGDPLFTLGWEGSGDINVPENPGRAAILSGGSIGAAYGPSVTVPQDAMGVLQFKVPYPLQGLCPPAYCLPTIPFTHPAIPIISISPTST